MALSRVPGDEDLYVGGIFTLRRKGALASTGITHIVSVLKYDYKSFEDWEQYEHLNIDVDDVEDENLLGEFEKTGSWIEEALRNGKDGKKGAVLVHCAMGKSRSVTVTIAYLLRQNPSHTVSSALDLIRQSRPIAEPNEGFMKQLELYKEMGCPRDIEAQPKYQRWLYQKEVDLALAAGMAPDKVRFEDEEVQDGTEGTGRNVELRCRKCRKQLATSQYLISHLPKASEKPPLSNKGPISSLPPTPTHNACQHHFLHPLSWMRSELEQGLLSGRLECPNSKCKAQIGRYAWQGMRCSCGIWVCPAVTLQKSRVDEVVKRGDGNNGQGVGGMKATGSVNSGPTSREETNAAVGIRLPPGMKMENL